MEGLSYLHKNMNIVIVENRFMQQSVKSRSVLGNAISTVGKKSILAFWRQIHLKIQCQPHGTWQFSEIQYKSDKGREKNHPAAGQGSTRSQNTCQIEFSSRKGHKQAPTCMARLDDSNCRRIVNTIPFINKYILMSIDCVYFRDMQIVIQFES